jgi:hypothetical protein
MQLVLQHSEELGARLNYQSPLHIFIMYIYASPSHTNTPPRIVAQAISSINSRIRMQQWTRQERKMLSSGEETAHKLLI